jgi:hypothetical protein
MSGSPPGMETMGAPHSSTASKHCCGRQALLQNVGGILDLAAAGAGQIAAEQRLEHQYERILLATGKLLPQHISRDGPHLRDGYWHPALFSWKLYGIRDVGY